MSTSTSTICHRNSEKHQREHIYTTLFPVYDSPYTYSVYFLNETTTEQDLDSLICYAQAAAHFFIDTESIHVDNSPALLQIYFTSSLKVNGLLLLLETKFLPSTSSSLFLKFQQLFMNIFKSTAHLYCWGSLIDELRKFVSLKIFSLPSSSTIHNLQQQFKSWFHRLIDRYLTSSTSDDNNDNQDVLIIDAPDYDPSLLLSTRAMVNKKQASNESWSLQHAILYTFGKYLSKKATLHKWSIGIDQRLPRRNLTYSSNYRNKLLNYACLDCISVAHLHEFMTNSNIPIDIHCTNENPTTGKCQSKRKKNVVSVLLQLTDEDSSSSEVYLSQMVTVHDKNERHRTPTPDITSSIYPKIISPRHELQSNEADLATHSYAADNIGANRHHNSFNHNDDNHVHRSSSNHKRKLSQVARKRRNKKTSLRHRINRYNFELIRPVNTTISNVKKILRSYTVPYLNINIVRSTLYIGLKSKVYQDYFDKRLPMDLFI